MAEVPAVRPSQNRQDYDRTNLKIEVDPKLEGGESDPGSDYESASSEYSTDSVTSSIYKYRFENGRRYHAYEDGKYTFPNDESEQERLDIIHHVLLILFDDKLHLAPIGPNPQRILDVGTGTGIWAIDAAERYPSAEVIGTDLSPIQPSWVPPNVQFQIDDAEKEWTFARDSFDLVHIRHLNGSIKDWQALLKQAYRVTKPGGWVEVLEYEMDLFSDDETLPETGFLKEFYRKLNTASEMIGPGFKFAASLEPVIENAGFINQNYIKVKTPLGTWPAEKKMKDIGTFLLLTAENAFEAVGMAMLTRVLGMDREDVQKLADGAKQECRSKKIHSYSWQYVYYAQKPSDP